MLAQNKSLEKEHSDFLGGPVVNTLHATAGHGFSPGVRAGTGHGTKTAHARKQPRQDKSIHTEKRRIKARVKSSRGDLWYWVCYCGSKQALIEWGGVLWKCDHTQGSTVSNKWGQIKPPGDSLGNLHYGQPPITAIVTDSAECHPRAKTIPKFNKMITIRF